MFPGRLPRIGAGKDAWWLAFDQFGQRQSLVADLRFHAVLEDVHSDHHRGRTVLQDQLRVIFDQVGPDFDPLVVVAVADALASLTGVNKLQRQDRIWMIFQG